MTRYAENTSVPVDRSKAEIERVLQRYGAEKFMSGWDQDRAMIGFERGGRMVKMILELPDRTNPEFAKTPKGRKRVESQVQSQWEGEVRRRWRALCLVVKAKFEAIESGISTFDEEFLSWLVLPGGMTLGERILPDVERMCLTGKLPPLLPSGRKGGA